MDNETGRLSFWSPRFHDTAKLSDIWRNLVLYRAEALLNRLNELSNLTIIFATDDALMYYAQLYRIPGESAENEDQDSDDDTVSDPSSDDDDSEEMIAAYESDREDAAKILASLNVDGDDAFTGSTNIAMEGSEPAWDGSVDGFNWPDVKEPPEHEPKSSDEGIETTGEASLDPFEGSADTSAPESTTWLTNAPGAPYTVFHNTFVTFSEPCAGDGQAIGSTEVAYSESPPNPSSTWLTNDPTGHNEADETGSSYGIWVGDETASLPADSFVPIPEDSSSSEEDDESGSSDDSSNKTNSEDIDEEEIDMLAAAPTTIAHPYSLYWPILFDRELTQKAEEYHGYLHKKKVLVENITRSNDLGQDEINTLLYNFVRQNLVKKPTVNSEELFKLKRFTDNVENFVRPMQRNINTIEADREQNKMRHYLPYASPDRLRSKRLGSSLRFVTNVDEEWDKDFDRWGVPKITKKRQQI
ncbi:hypothetical protein FLONG3_8699 [Fusarium longipes]|uniref:Uncharacterized protein n=1 Tax=Fusarium longipes TaxID=694270 RepID=A0A395S383_9HYPO|nr:hypothetical protein FLONG3_8699 [Fusarium longipes]